MIEFETGTREDAADALVVGVGAGRAFDDLGRTLLDAIPWLAGHLDDADFTGKAGQSTMVPAGEGVPYRSVVLVGTGEGADAEQIRRVAGSAAKALSRMTTVATTLHAHPVPGAAEAAAMGFVMGSYGFDRHKSEKKASAISKIVFVDGSDADLAAASAGSIVGEAVRIARDLVNEPAIGKAPAELADRAIQLLAGTSVQVRVLQEDEIVAERLGGLRGVSLGAHNPPRLVEMTYDPPGAKGFLALVGKGIVFDSGGLSLKSADNMEAMKTDMAGAAAVMAAIGAIARLELPVKVLGITPLTENMPGGGALRPGDVLQARNGKTIEVLNTDAEGRLVLADGLSLAAEQEPDLILDLATLTGSCKVALGEKIAGLMGDDATVQKVAEAAGAAGERVWHLPLPPDYRKKIDSEVADMKNTGGRWGGALTAGLLLKEFVGDTPWAHLDIAGPARSDESDAYVTKGGTGFGVRTIVELAKRM